jgi:hypothetical protein
MVLELFRSHLGLQNGLQTERFAGCYSFAKQSILAGQRIYAATNGPANGNSVLILSCRKRYRYWFIFAIKELEQNTVILLAL